MFNFIHIAIHVSTSLGVCNKILAMSVCGINLFIFNTVKKIKLLYLLKILMKNYISLKKIKFLKSYSCYNKLPYKLPLTQDLLYLPRNEPEKQNCIELKQEILLYTELL